MKRIETYSFSSNAIAVERKTNMIHRLPLLVLFNFLMKNCGAATEAGNNNNKIMLEDFSSSTASSHLWFVENDLELGGRSTGDFKKMKKDEKSVGRFVGHVKILSFMQVPGFIKVETLKGETSSWPDISSCEGLELALESHTDYNGFRVSFGQDIPKSGSLSYRYGYKADLKIPVKSSSDGNGNNVSLIKLPFTEFTDNWDSGTGNAIKTCRENIQYCPDQDTLSENLYSMAIWGEGVKGDIDLDLHSIQAYGCSIDGVSSKSNVNDKNSSEDNEILIEDFANPINRWQTLNDPVMGGESTSAIAIKDGVAKFHGEVKPVPIFDNAPGFVTMLTGDHYSIASNKFSSSSSSSSSSINASTFPDVSHCQALKLLLRSSKNQKHADDYAGYRISFGTHHENDIGYPMGYKAPAFTNIPTKIGVEEYSAFTNIPVGKEFSEFIFPFDTFSGEWDDATGDILVPCSLDNQSVCPSQKVLQNLQIITIWGEGVLGEISLEIKSISAVECSSKRTNTSSNTNNKPVTVYSSTVKGGNNFKEEQLQNTQSTQRAYSTVEKSTAVEQEQQLQNTQSPQRTYYPSKEIKKKNSNTMGFFSRICSIGLFHLLWCYCAKEKIIQLTSCNSSDGL